MRRAERLFRLVNEMRTRGVSRASDLAEVFEVSPTTIYRDIAHLQASGLPIEGEAGIGYMLRPGFDLPNTTFSPDQLDALAMGLAFVERTGDPTLALAAREARAKLQAGLPDPEERLLADAPFYNLQAGQGAEMLSTLRRAIRDRLVVQIAYQRPDAGPSLREVQPLVVWNLTDGWMVSGWCRLRRDFRTFRHDRIADLSLTGARFEEDAETGLRAFMALEACH